jgi:hypothetical protein
MLHLLQSTDKATVKEEGGVMFYCTACGMPFKKPKCTALGCDSREAERFPPLDGFVTFILDGYDKTEEQELEEREAFFNKKRERRC